jgi:lipoic acid synthetase
MLEQDQFQIFPASKKKRLNVLPPNPEQAQVEKAVKPGRFPSWLHRPLPKGNALRKTGKVLANHRLHTVCEEAKCPNLLECWSHRTATFLIMGKECTRSCGFCDIDFAKVPHGLEEDEPKRVAESVKELGLRHVVITMVARDDLEDGGSAHLVRVISEVRNLNPKVVVEVLTSDFNGQEDAWETILEASPEVFNHNIETVRALTPRVRHKATYDRTLDFLRYASSRPADSPLKIKSGLMVGLGEKEEEVYQTLDDLKEAGCDIVTIGQYLQPNRQKLLVKEFVTPEQFKKYEEYGYKIGISFMYSGPFVRSSYHAHQALEIQDKNDD